MSEERVRELTEEMVTMQLRAAQVKREKGSQAEIVDLDAKIMETRRLINWELRALSQEEVHTLDVETDDTQRNR